jgi:NitT/TauT family transport system ATP-binding protein
LHFEAVSCDFIGDRAGTAYAAVAEVSFTVAPGEFVSVVGPTGCGKSTLLNMAAGLLAPSAGSVSVLGSPLNGINTHAGYMFQSESLMPWRTVLGNIRAGLEFRGLGKIDADRESQDWLRRVGLGGFGDRYPHQLSGGMRKRASLAQTLVLDPDIILMDEPFSALDIQTRQLMENELLEIWTSRRKAVLFITHDLDEAIALSDRVLVMSAGPAASVIDNFVIDLPRPRNVAEMRSQPETSRRFSELHDAIWKVLRDQVLAAYQQQQHAPGLLP